MRIPDGPRRFLKQAYFRLTWQLGRTRWLRPALHPLMRWTLRNSPWMRPHPFDAEHGTETAGFVPGWLLGAGRAHETNHGYGGCQPSCLRRILSTLPDLARFTFVDIGCGKGRALIVASEWPFQEIIGIEVDPALCRTARTNASIVHARFPARTSIEIVEADATTFNLPGTNLVMFIYHPFGVDLLRMLVTRLAAAAETRSVFMIYEYPEFSYVPDAEPRLRRWCAETVPRDPSERGLGSGADETVVCWASRWEPTPSRPGADAIIEISGEGARLRTRVFEM